jgi:hypothetical protein
MTTTAAQTYSREGAELGDLRSTNSAAAREGAMQRGELPSYTAAVLERMGELVLAGFYAEARAMHRREFERS